MHFLSHLVICGINSIFCVDSLIVHSHVAGSACVDLGVPHASIRDIKDKKNKVRVSYRCEDGYRLIGRQNITCSKETGKWNAVPPVCKSK